MNRKYRHWMYRNRAFFLFVRKMSVYLVFLFFGLCLWTYGMNEYFTTNHVEVEEKEWKIEEISLQESEEVLSSETATQEPPPKEVRAILPKMATPKDVVKVKKEEKQTVEEVSLPKTEEAKPPEARTEKTAEEIDRENLERAKKLAEDYERQGYEVHIIQR